MMLGVIDNPKTVAILQARMSSSRLPGKVLKEICGKPMLELQLERLSRCTLIDTIVVATSDQTDDDPIASLCQSFEVPCFRGSLDDVLDRFYQCARKFEATHVVRLTGDCPLADPGLIDDLVRFYFEQDIDYASNARPPTLPDGLDAEIFTFAALEKAWREGRGAHAREHVVPYIIRNPEHFTIANWRHTEDLSGQRWTVDEPEDFAFVTEVYQTLYPDNPDFGLQDILSLLAERPELIALNTHIERNAGSRKS